MLVSILATLAPAFQATPLPRIPADPEPAPASRLHFGDVDGDGLDDALVIGPAGSVTLLWNHGEGRFEDVTFASGLGELPFATCALLADLDGDLDLDLYAGSSEIRLWRNLGNAAFEPVQSGIEHDLVDLAASAVDHDQDGLPDLTLHTEAGDLFYRNAGAGRFERVELPGAEHPADASQAIASAIAIAESEHGPASPTDSPGDPSPAGRRMHRWQSVQAAVLSTTGSLPPSGTTAVGPTLGSADALPSCLPGIRDQASISCLKGSSQPTLGMLYPLSTNLFVDDATGFVGIGTLSPSTTLHVAGKLLAGTGNSAAGANATVTGGSLNSAAGVHATIAGGESNTAGTSHAFIGGGLSNLAIGTRSVIGGGVGNSAGSSAVVGGGGNNDADFSFATVAGGRFNGADATYAAVAGGSNNHASGQYAFVGGGGDDTNALNGNTASGLAAAVGGGRANLASGDRSTTAGGSSNQATSQHTSVGGGRGNSAFGAFGTVPGGELNIAAGSHALAAGRRAKALHDGTFVWADSTDADFVSTAPNQVMLRASGGVGIDRAPGLAMKLDVNGTVRASDTIVSTKASGAPFSIASTDLSTNLNADLLDGFHATAFSMLGAQIETGELADGAVTSAKIADATIANADVSGSAAIAGTKVAPNFGTQDVVTTGRMAIGTSTLAEQLTVAGVIQSTSGGIKFPDGTLQATAQLVGPQGPAGPQGPQGPPGPLEPPEPTASVGTAELFDQGSSQGAPLPVYAFELWHDSVSTSLPGAGPRPILKITRDIDDRSRLFHMVNNGYTGVDLRIVLTALNRPGGGSVVLDLDDLRVVEVTQHDHAPSLMREDVTLTSSTMTWAPSFGTPVTFVGGGSWTPAPFLNQPLRYDVSQSPFPPPVGTDRARSAQYSAANQFTSNVLAFEIEKPASADTGAMLSKALAATTGAPALGSVSFEINPSQSTPVITYTLPSGSLVDWRMETSEALIREHLWIEGTTGQVTVNGFTTSL